MSADLKTALEKFAKDDYAAEEMLALLWPVIEAADDWTNLNCDESCGAEIEDTLRALERAFGELKEKVGVK